MSHSSFKLSIQAWLSWSCGISADLFWANFDVRLQATPWFQIPQREGMPKCSWRKEAQEAPLTCQRRQRRGYCDLLYRAMHGQQRCWRLLPWTCVESWYMSEDENCNNCISKTPSVAQITPEHVPSSFDRFCLQALPEATTLTLCTNQPLSYISNLIIWDHALHILWRICLSDEIDTDCISVFLDLACRDVLCVVVCHQRHPLWLPLRAVLHSSGPLKECVEIKPFCQSMRGKMREWRSGTSHVQGQHGCLCKIAIPWFSLWSNEPIVITQPGQAKQAGQSLLWIEGLSKLWLALQSWA